MIESQGPCYGLYNSKPRMECADHEFIGLGGDSNKCSYSAYNWKDTIAHFIGTAEEAK